jgi:fatty acid desaturase
MVQSPPETRALAQLLARYREPDSAGGVFELVITAVPFLVIWGLMWIVLADGHWIGMLLAAPAAGLLVRLFMIQHDCGHGSFFHGRLANDWVGRAIGIVTLTPYDYWRRNHALHHASSGNLDHRGFGDIDTLTVREFLARPRWRQNLYRLYRHPIVMFGVGPTYLFILRHRLPIGMRRPWARVQPQMAISCDRARWSILVTFQYFNGWRSCRLTTDRFARWARSAPHKTPTASARPCAGAISTRFVLAAASHARPHSIANCAPRCGRCS